MHDLMARWLALLLLTAPLGTLFPFMADAGVTAVGASGSPTPSAAAHDTAPGAGHHGNDAAAMVVANVFFDDRATARRLARELSPWEIDYQKGYLVVGVPGERLAALRAAGLRIEVDAARTAWYGRAPGPRRGQVDGIPGFPCYRTVEETLADAEAIAEVHPDLAEWTVIGGSWEQDSGLGGYDVSVLRLTNERIGGDKPKLFVMSAIHAREYATAELNTRFAEYLVTNYGVDADVTWLLDAHEIHLALQTNPDGRKQAETGLVWRKNTNRNYCGPGSNSRGADLNRNFDFLWGCCGGSSGFECNDTYRGPFPASEPETRNVRDYVRALFEDRRGEDIGDAAPLDTPGVFLDVHSYGQLVLWPWGWGGTGAPNEDGLTTLGRKLAWFNDYLPIQAIDLYPTDGTTIDFAYGELGVAAYAFEVGTEFFENCGVFEQIVLPDNLDALLYAAKAARAPYLAPAGPEVTALALSTLTVAPGEGVTLTATADDTRFSADNGQEATQPIQVARAWVDVPPWTGARADRQALGHGDAPIELQAVDGAFDETVEDVTGRIDTTGLATGRHTIYVEAEDAAGNRGVVSAAFLYVIDPIDAGQLTGTVAAADSGAPLAATVSAPPFSTTTVNGSYSLSLPPGEYTVQATPESDAYAASLPVTVAVQAAETRTVDFALAPWCLLRADDVEAGNAGWTAQGDWAISNERADSPTRAWSDSPGGDYGSNVEASLISPVLDLEGFHEVRLRLSQICDTEATYDFCYVEYSTDGVHWDTTASFDGPDTDFDPVTLALPALAGAPRAQVRLRMSTDFNVFADGWHVDDVRIEGTGAGCAGADTDDDGILDAVDSCTLVPDTAQRDSNADGFGNVCDADLNDDGIVNLIDWRLFRPRIGTANPDADFDGDGIVGLSDFQILRDSLGRPPGPAGDGVP